MLAIALAGLVIASGLTFFPIVTPIANAMTQVQAGSGFPGDEVTVIVRNDFTGPAFAPWTVQAPPGTSIVSASGSAASGASPFACSGNGASVQCGPSGIGGWAANNIVTVQLRIDAAAAAGYRSAVSRIAGGEEGLFGLTVLAPPAPVLTAPSEGLRTLDTAPTLSGSKRAGNDATALVDGAAACHVAADASTSWSCIPSSPLAPGAHSVSATQRSPAGDVSPSSTTRSIEILTPATVSVRQDGATTQVPTVAFRRSVSISNGGPGTATDVLATVDLGGLPVTACEIAGVDIDCPQLRAGVGLGALAPGTSAVVSITGTVPSDTPAGTTYAVTASARSINDAASPVTSVVTVSVVAPAAPVITRPVAASVTTDRSSAVSGTALAGATITVTAATGIAVCSTVATGDGTWSCRPAGAFEVGSVAVQATQRIGGLTSNASGVREFRVIALTVVVPPTSRPPTRPSSPPIPPRVPESGVPSPPIIDLSPVPLTAPLRAIALNLRFAGSSVSPGTVTAMRGTIGPNNSAEPVAITLTGTVNKGIAYRTVRVDPDGTCDVRTTMFSCTMVVPPGESAAVEIRMFADPLNAPPAIRQQMTVTSSDSGQNNTATSTINVETDDDADAASLLTLNMASFPGAFLPLLALLLFALAATVTEQGRRSRAAHVIAAPLNPDTSPRPQENSE